MKAAYLEEYGGPEVLKFGDVPDPVARADEVIVDVHAASVNAADWKVRSGTYGADLRFPYVLGRDFSGIVNSAGREVTDLAVGDAVFGVCDVGQEGALRGEDRGQGRHHREEAGPLLSRGRGGRFPRRPHGSGFDRGHAATPTGGENTHSKAGQAVVAGFGIQLAKHIGAHVVTTASAANRDYLVGLGADEIIDYIRPGLRRGRDRLRRRIRDRGRRRRGTFVQGVEARGTNRLHRVRLQGAGLAAGRRSGPQAPGEPGSPSSGENHRAAWMRGPYAFLKSLRSPCPKRPRRTRSAKGVISAGSSCSR